MAKEFSIITEQKDMSVLNFIVIGKHPRGGQKKMFY